MGGVLDACRRLKSNLTPAQQVKAEHTNSHCHKTRTYKPK